MMTSSSDVCSLQPLVRRGIWHFDVSSAVHGCPQRGERSRFFGLVHGVSQNKFRAVRRFRARCREAAKTLAPNDEMAETQKEKICSDIHSLKLELKDEKVFSDFDAEELEVLGEYDLVPEFLGNESNGVEFVDPEKENVHAQHSTRLSNERSGSIKRLFADNKQNFQCVRWCCLG